MPVEDTIRQLAVFQTRLAAQLPLTFRFNYIGHQKAPFHLQAPGTAAVVRDLLLGTALEIDCSYFTPAAITALTGTEVLK
jgi:hypothetical protein